MIIGVPKEIMLEERRVAATPETTTELVAMGHSVLIEKDAGVGSFFSDDEYRAAGGEIVDDIRDLYERADLIIKVKEPLYNEQLAIHEVELMRAGQYLITFIHPASPSNHTMVQALAKQGVISLTLDGVPRISRAQNMDALTSMSTCAGYKGMIMAAEEYADFMPPIFSAAGSTKPAKALVIGTGVAGLQALATAKRLGAICYAIDVRPPAQEQAVSLGAKIVKTGLPAEAVVGAGGYALELSADYLDKERAAIAEILTTVDILFLAALVPGKRAPILVTEEMVKSMKAGSVIIDVSIDQGGNCALTEGGAIISRYGVSICGIKNIPARLPVSATRMLAGNMLNLVKYYAPNGVMEIDPADEIALGMLTTADYKVVHQGALEAMEREGA